MKRLLSIALLCSSIGMCAMDKADDAQGDDRSAETSGAFEYTTEKFEVNNKKTSDGKTYETVFFARRYLPGRNGFTSDEHKLFHFIALSRKSNLEVTCYKDGLFFVKSNDYTVGCEMEEAGFEKTSTPRDLLKALAAKMKAETSAAAQNAAEAGDDSRTALLDCLI